LTHSIEKANDVTSQTGAQTLQVQSIATLEMPDRPVLAPNVQLIGELKESGFKDRQWLIQRDGQFIQLTELLYHVAEQANGEHTLEEIAASVTEATEWLVSPDNVRQIVQTKLIPMRLVATVDGSVAPRGGGANNEERQRSPLAVNMHMKMISPRIIGPIARGLQFLHAPPVLIPILIIIAIAHGWLYLVHGVARSIRDALSTPGLLLIILVIMLIASVFHEFGHASALRYGGGKVRGMGAGIYLVYPAFYTDVTDSYRLGRWAKVRTDLGGFYFSLIFALGIIAFFLAFRQEFLLLIVVLIDLDIIFQIMPFVRFDGYWALADLTGIPDFFSQIGPFLRSVLPLSAWRGSKLPSLKPWVKAIFASYIIVTIFALTFLLFLMVVYVPTMVITTWDALLVQNAAFTSELSNRNVPGIGSSVVQELILSLPLWMTVYLFYMLGRGPLRTIWHWSKLRRKRRIAGALGATAAIALVAFFWIPQLSSLIWPIQSKAVDGIACDQAMYAMEHIHAHLAIYVKDQALLVPEGIGIPKGGKCFYWLHTHRFDGVIHVEASSRGTYTLGQFTDIWAQTMHTSVMTSTSFLGYPLNGHQLVIWISNNGQPPHLYTGNLRNLALQNHEIITIAYDSPQVRPVTNFDWLNSSAGG
jgi:putative peptide zinc metalloprotease protein